MNIEPRPVLTVRGTVSTAALLASAVKSSSGPEPCQRSRTRSNTTTVSLTESPTMVMAAARKIPSMGFSSQAKSPTTSTTSWAIARTAATPKVHLKRKAR